MRKVEPRFREHRARLNDLCYVLSGVRDCRLSEDSLRLISFTAALGRRGAAHG